MSPPVPEPVPAAYNVLALVPASRRVQPAGRSLSTPVPELTSESKLWTYAASSADNPASPAAWLAGATATSPAVVVAKAVASVRARRRALP